VGFIRTNRNNSEKGRVRWVTVGDEGGGGGRGKERLMGARETKEGKEGG